MDVHDTIRAIAAAVATRHERFTRYTVETPHNYCGSILGSNDATIFIRLEKGRLVIAGTYPDREYRHRSVKITVAADRDPILIAREICRRLLPEYLTQLTEVQARVAERKQAERDYKVVEATITTHPLIETYGTTGTLILTVPGTANDYIQFSLNHDGSSARIERGNLPTALLLRLADTLKERR